MHDSSSSILIASLRGNLPQIKPFVVSPFDLAEEGYKFRVGAAGDEPFDRLRAGKVKPGSRLRHDPGCSTSASKTLR
jgi:hypothetical protein